MGIIVPLVHWFGTPLFKELLATEAISFVHTSGGLGYSGNDVGLVMFKIHPNKEKLFVGVFELSMTRVKPKKWETYSKIVKKRTILI